VKSPRMEHGKAAVKGEQRAGRNVADPER
jgi:hypothetical protein